MSGKAINGRLFIIIPLAYKIAYENKSSMKKYIIIIYLSFLLELAFITFWRAKLGIYISPVVLFLASLGVGILPLLFYSRLKLMIPGTSVNKILSNVLVFAVFASGSILCFLVFRNILIKIPYDFVASEVTTSIDIMSKRLLQGEFPYSLITDYGHNLPPTYLTLQWLPFTISSYYEFDHRYMVIGTWIFAMLIYTISLNQADSSLYKKLFFTALPFLVLLIFMYDIPTVFGASIELLPTSYYILLILTLFSSSLIIRSMGIVLPLLSRFSFLFWLPLYFLFSFLSEKRWKSILMGTYTLILVLILYFIPFFLKDTGIFKKGADYYTKAALDEWHPHEWQEQDAKPFQLFRGIGFAAYYYDFANGEIPVKLRSLKRTHLTLSVLVAFIMGFIWFRFRDKIPVRWYLLLSLKVYLAFFYAFIQVPYIYLQLVPLFISILIMASLSMKTKKGIVSLAALFEANN